MYKKNLFLLFLKVLKDVENLFKVKNLFNKLKKNKADTILTREPGGTKSSELIRNLILKDYFNKNKKKNLINIQIHYYILAARNEHVKNKIRPALLKKKVVICDRFTDSTIAYQVYGKKVDINFINNIHKKILHGIKPNLVFILKVSKKFQKKRLKKRKIKK